MFHLKFNCLKVEITLMLYVGFLSTSFALSPLESQPVNLPIREKKQVLPDTIPLPMQLQSASLNYQTNGSVLYEIQVRGAADGFCYFMFEDIADVAFSAVTQYNDVITGVILMKEIPRWLYFSCYDNTNPVGVRYMLNTDLYSNQTTLMQTWDEVNCKFSKPVHSSQERCAIIEIEASCDCALSRRNAMISLQGIELKNGQVMYTGDFESSYNQTTKYENGVIKTKFAALQDILNGLDIELTFTLTLRDKRAYSPISRASYLLTYDKSFDGSRPAVSIGTVAIQVFPSDIDVIYVKRGSKIRLTCEAYGNPRPTVTWYKGSSMQTGQTDVIFGNWNKFYAYQFLVLSDFDSVNEGDYKCRAEVDGKVKERTKSLKLCEPVNIQFSYYSDNVMVSVTFEANQNDTNKIEHYSCYSSNRPFRDTWIAEYRDPSVTIVDNNTDTYFRADITWRRGDGVTIPREMYCKFYATCKIDGAVYRMNI